MVFDAGIMKIQDPSHPQACAEWSNRILILSLLGIAYLTFFPFRFHFAASFVFHRFPFLLGASDKHSGHLDFFSAPRCVSGAPVDGLHFFWRWPLERAPPTSWNCCSFTFPNAIQDGGIYFPMQRARSQDFFFLSFAAAPFWRNCPNGKLHL